jgi:small redox-active disulfide protein 2
MIIKVLGSGCSRCEKLFKRVNNVVKINNINADIIKIEDIKEFMRYGIMMTPALVINEKLVCSINVPSEKDILKHINENS